MPVRYVVVGGGIAGVSCAQAVVEWKASADDTVTLVSASATVKVPRNVKHLARTVVTFDVVEENVEALAEQGIAFVHAQVDAVDTAAQVIVAGDQRLPYDRVCICSGASPKLFAQHPHVVSIRDTDSVLELARRLEHARRIAVVGNGGIALELAYVASAQARTEAARAAVLPHEMRMLISHAVRGCELVWVIREDTIGTNFFDEAAAKFLVDGLTTAKVVGPSDSLERFNVAPASGVAAKASCAESSPVVADHDHGAIGGDGSAGRKRRRPSEPDTVPGAALGPNWNALFHAAQGTRIDAKGAPADLTLVLRDEVASVVTGLEWPVIVHLTSNRTLGCDFVVSAIGVAPHIPFAGPEARIMGLEAGRAMAEDAEKERISTGENTGHLSLAFEMFSHVTEFFGLKVILLGLYNGQGLTPPYEVHLRCTPGHEYVKVVVLDGRLVGALLIGDTDLEETFENLILNGTDVSRYGEALLDPDVDLEDYFD